MAELTALLLSEKFIEIMTILLIIVIVLLFITGALTLFYEGNWVEIAKNSKFQVLRGSKRNLTSIVYTLVPDRPQILNIRNKDFNLLLDVLNEANNKLEATDVKEE